MTPLLDIALAAAARGWPVFPCAPQAKIPAIAKSAGGNGVLDATTDQARIGAWWAAMPDANVGIATGTPGPDVVDFDTDGDFAPALAAMTQAEIINGQQSFVRTRSGGYHVYFEGTTQRSTTLRTKTGPWFPVDFKAAGGYVIAPGCYVAADDKPGGYYEVITEGSPEPGPIDWRMTRDILVPKPEFQQPAAERAALADTRGYAGTSYAAAKSWPEILTPHGWRQIRQVGNVRYWCRPQKTGRFISASTRDDGGLWVFSTATSFEPEQLYSKFGAYTVLHGFGSDYKAAAAQLRREGYGDPLPGPAFNQPAPVATAAPDVAQAVAGRPLPDFDLGALAEAGIKEPERLAGGMLYRASVHCLAGVPGGGKTTLMAWWMLQHIRDGGHVMLLDEESGPEQAAEKFLDLGAIPDELRPPRFTYVPFPARGWNATDVAQLHALITERNPGIIGWDSVAAFLAIAGADENSASDVTAFWQKVLMPCARRFGAAVIGIDHIPKNGDSAGYGRGSGAKKAASDVQYMMETVKPFNRQQDGILRLTTAPGKDRRGWLPTAYQIHVKTGEPVTLEISEATEQITSGKIEMKPGKAKLWEALQAIATEAQPASAGQLVDWIARTHGHGLKRPTVSTYLNELAADGLAQPVSVKPGLPKFWYPLITDGDTRRSDPSGDTPIKSVSGRNDQAHSRDQHVSAVQGQFQPTRNPSPDASALTRQVVSAPPIGADNPANTLTADVPQTGPCTGCGEPAHPGRDCFARSEAAS
jgi:hypothetical protein